MDMGNMVGKCECCGEENVVLERRYFYYPGIKNCECHSPQHFIAINHCKKCILKEPEYSKVEFKTDDLKHPERIASDILKELFSENSYDIELRDKLKSSIKEKVFELYKSAGYDIEDKIDELVDSILIIFISHM